MKEKWKKLREKIKEDLNVDIGFLKLMNYKDLYKKLINIAPVGKIDEFLDYFLTYERDPISYRQIIGGEIEGNEKVQLDNIKIYISEYATVNSQKKDKLESMSDVAVDRGFFIKFSKEIPNYLYLYYLEDLIQRSQPGVRLLMKNIVDMYENELLIYKDVYYENFILEDKKEIKKRKEIIKNKHPLYYRLKEKSKDIFLEDIKNKKFTQMKFLTDFLTRFPQIPTYELKGIEFFSIDDTKTIFDNVVEFLELIGKVKKEKKVPYIS